MSPTQIAITPTPGSPIRVLASVLATPAALITVAVFPGATGNVYVGTSALNKTTGQGVIATLTPSSVPLRIETADGTNQIQPADYYVDADNVNGIALVTYWASTD